MQIHVYVMTTNECNGKYKDKITHFFKHNGIKNEEIKKLYCHFLNTVVFVIHAQM